MYPQVLVRAKMVPASHMDWTETYQIWYRSDIGPLLPVSARYLIDVSVNFSSEWALWRTALEFVLPQRNSQSRYVSRRYTSTKSDISWFFLPVSYSKRYPRVSKINFKESARNSCRVKYWMIFRKRNEASRGSLNIHRNNKLFHKEEKH